MKMRICLTALPLLAGCLSGCYTQLYTGGYAERTVYPYPYDRPATARDSALADSLDSVADADTLHHPKTVIVNNYYDNSPYYRGYSIDAWDYPFISLGFYSGRYRDYYGPYWWQDGYGHRGHYRRYYDSYPGGGSTSGSSHPNTRIFPFPSSQPPLHKGRRSESAAPAANGVLGPRGEAAGKPAAHQTYTAPAESSRSSSDGNSSSGSSGSSSSSGSSNSSSGSSGSSGSSNGSGNDHPDVHKGRR